MPIRQCQAGEFIFREGDVADVAYFILDGKIEIIKHAGHGDIQLATLGKGDIFGEMGLFETAPRSASARALEECNLHTVDQSELQHMIMQCPEPLMSIIRNTFERLRNTNKRLSERETAIVDLPCNFKQIRILPAGPKLADRFPPHLITFNQLPYIIGGYAEDEENRKPRGGGLLALPCEGPPLAISKRHLGIEIQEQSIFLVDRGSRFGTIVNGRPIGKGKGHYKIPLQQGEFDIQFGERNSPYQIKLICE